MPEPLIKVVITGAESTGKSVLAEALSQHYKAPWVPELARSYIEKLDHHYTFSDVESIAKAQIEEEKQHQHGLVVFDTWLIITKVWFDFVYGQHPRWLDQHIQSSQIDLFLLCNIDLPWIPDPLRENGGENRIRLHEIYLHELENYGFTYRIISGTGHVRITNAINAIDDLMIKKGFDLFNFGNDGTR